MLHSAIELNRLYNSEYVDKVMENDYDAGEPLVEAVKELFPDVKSVIDIGCNNGVHMKHFWDKGFVVAGVDISSAAFEKLLVPRGFISLCDLREPIVFDAEYDLAIAIEVIEHIEEEALDQFIMNLRNASPLLIATPGNQPGTGHFNMRPKEWWINKFMEYGMYYDKYMSNKLLSFLNKQEWENQQKRFPFIKQSAMVYRRYG